MSIGKIQASLASGTQETTIALAALNFDFSLFKTAPPQELVPLGAALNSRRREMAEDGDIHSTARKLRAMFESMLPSAPHLFRAYGLRASEIAKAESFKQANKESGGAFVQHLGIDGGSIWAAATSGQGAVAIHLLACMLARVWSAAEATSIWAELVSTRKKELSELDPSEIQNIAALGASRSVPTRAQLADWDASARAWLRVADEACRVKHRQLKLIIENINLVVNNLNNVYRSVTTAWRSAMQVMDKVIEGMPHSIIDSSALLAMSAWHLYPDMLVLSQSNQFIRQKDDLVDSRGILSLGLQNADNYHPLNETEEMSQGITWSLPLAYYRFYGDPEQRKRNLNVDASRISLAQLNMIAIGSFFSQWQEPRFNLDRVSSILIALWQYLQTGEVCHGIPLVSDRSWLGVFHKTALDFKNSKDLLRVEYTRLYNYGRRFCPKLVCGDEQSPIVRLRDPKITLSLMHNPMTKTGFLRRIASRLGCSPTLLLLRVMKHHVEPSEKGFTFMTVTEEGFSTLRIGPGVERTAKSEARQQSGDEDCIHLEDVTNQKQSDGIIIGPIEGSSKLLWANAPAHLAKHQIKTEIDDFFGQFAEFALFEGKVNPYRPRVIRAVPYEYVCGDVASAAIFRIVQAKSAVKEVLDAEEIIDTLKTCEFDPLSLLEHLGGLPAMRTSIGPGLIARSLKTLSCINHIYEMLPQASVAMSVTSDGLWKAKWMPRSDMWPDLTVGATDYRARGAEYQTRGEICTAFEPSKFDLATAFACIVQLESGTINLQASGLHSVLAISSGDSLFIAQRLLQDPAEPSEDLITRLRGNVGRAGIALLIPPQHSRMREINPGDWNLMDEREFDGNVIDCFQNTSLHMSFTNYVLPVDTGAHGACDTEIYFLETVISAHDKGEWIGDLDVLLTFKSQLLRRIPGCTCSSSRDQNHPAIVTQRRNASSQSGDGATSENNDENTTSLQSEMFSIDSWQDFLGRSDETSVLRAHGNWMARLAAATFSVSQGHLTLLFGNNGSKDDATADRGGGKAKRICWKCGQREYRHLKHKGSPLYIL